MEPGAAVATPDLSVIIVNWNTRALLGDCLRSFESAAGPVLEIFVVDNGSTDGSLEMVEREHPHVRRIANAENVGFARANNQALALATGRYALLLNSDTRVAPGALACLTRFMDEHPRAGACGPRLVNPDGTLQPSGRSFPSTPAALAALLPVGASVRAALATPLERRDHAREAAVDEVSGAALCLRRAALGEVGTLDEGFFLFGEDVDLCWRLRKAGWTVHYVPGAEVTHVWGGSRAAQSERVRQLNRRAWVRLMRKHRPGLPAATIGAVTMMLTVAEGLARALRSRLRGERDAARSAWRDLRDQLDGLRAA